MPAALVPVLAFLVILAIDPWVYADAKQRTDQGAPVVVRIGAFVLETPETWFVGWPDSVDHLLPALHGEPRAITPLQGSPFEDRPPGQLRYRALGHVTLPSATVEALVTPREMRLRAHRQIN
jgi:hypothetical protein